ncbi:MAG: efflux RND transporter periplasmic adaptor subunit [Candidatus Peribacteraceae bacterium]|nr:efflux RND transporter periplasmic adaptor subunit [Candidatus Peribacteraceae bacterium]
MIYKILKRNYGKITAVGLTIVFAFTAVGCGDNSEDSVVDETYIPSVETAIVAPGLSREITTTGEVQAVKSATLTSEVRADVQNVFVKVGAEVRAGQTLLQLSSASVSSSRSTAGAAYVNAQNSLTQTQLSAEKSVESAQVGLETAQISLANTLAQNEALRLQAEETLNAAKLSSGLSVSSAQTTLDNAVRSASPTADAAVTDCDEIIGVSPINKNANDDYEYLLGAFKSASKPIAENAIETALIALNTSPTDYDSARKLLELAENAAIKTLDVLNNSNVGSDYTQTTLNSDISIINTQISTVRTAISTLDSAKAALDSAAQNSNGTSQSVLSAEANYAATLAQLSANEQSARQAVESAKAALESAQKSAELSKTSAAASLNSIAGNLNQAQISVSKLTIRAPFTGKVTAVEVEAGDEIAAGATLVRVEDASQLKIVAYLSAAEVRKVHVGDEVKIATRSSDVIASIAPSADPVTKKYAVEIYHQNPYLQPGEFVKLRFQIGEGNSENDKRIFLPLTAINILASGNFIWVVEDGQALKRPIILGALEGEYVEIISGLEMGEEVIVEGGRVLDEAKDEIAIEVVN